VANIEERKIPAAITPIALPLLKERYWPGVTVIPEKTLEIFKTLVVQT
jgi:hypothetical protein